ncbi:MAG: endolytic transglycosylase MltG [Bacteroidia bacterium]
MARKKSSFKRIMIWLFTVILIIAAAGGYLLYSFIYGPNVDLHGQKTDFLYIPTGSNFDDVSSIINKNNFIKNKTSFEWVAKRKNYLKKVLPGRYLINNGMSNDEFINLLRSGKQEPLNLTFTNIRTKKQLASIVGSKLEADSIELLQLLNDTAFAKKMGFNKETIMCLFIPNTYQFFWTTNDSAFIKRMAREYKNFWNEERRAKAKQIGMTTEDVTILASIVQEETNMTADKPIVAGVYINRLNKNMTLDADPTLKFAIGDFTIQRLLNEDKLLESPYNTYKYAGLPPGPINLPAIETIDAVLNYTNHDYLFFCAREDFSGYSNFAATYEQHLVNARKYQAELNRRNIKR